MGNEREKLAQVKAVGILLDSKIEGPFGIRFGLDALLGLVPVVGDFSTSLAALYIIGVAAEMGCPFSILMRMILNIVWENIVGAVPFFGNVFDFYWKANNKNVALLESYMERPAKVSRRSNLILGLFFLFLILILFVTASFTVVVLSYLLNWIISLR